MCGITELPLISDSQLSLSLPLAILFNTMSIKMYVPVRPLPSLMDKKQDE